MSITRIIGKLWKGIRERLENKNNLDKNKNIEIKRKIEYSNLKNKEKMLPKHQAVIVEVPVRKNLNNLRQVFALTYKRCLIKRNFRSEIKYQPF